MAKKSSDEALKVIQRWMEATRKATEKQKEGMDDETKKRLDEYGERMKPLLMKMLSGGLYRGQMTAMLAIQDINILNVIQTEKKTRFLVEFKWWYGEAPSESRWQRTTVCVEDELPEDLIFPYISLEVSLARHGLKELTGVSQDVRH